MTPMWDWGASDPDDNKPKNERYKSALEAIVALHNQWCSETDPSPLDVLCEMSEIAHSALGIDHSVYAEEAIQMALNGQKIDHWLG